MNANEPVETSALESVADFLRTLSREEANQREMRKAIHVIERHRENEPSDNICKIKQETLYELAYNYQAASRVFECLPNYNSSRFINGSVESLDFARFHPDKPIGESLDGS